MNDGSPTHDSGRTAPAVGDIDTGAALEAENGHGSPVTEGASGELASGELASGQLGGRSARSKPRAGKVQLVATPIGNLDDLSPRARRALEQADLVACEDTRHSGRLMAHLGLRQRLISMHDHNEHRRLPQILEALEDGQTVAVISDAGTPLVSDPGFLLVRGAAERGIPVEPIPGPSAILAALVASALPPHPFTFAGFAPPRSPKRRSFYRQWGEAGHTIVLFESPHRLLASLADARAEIGDERPAAVCRELTKMHEEVLRGDLRSLHMELLERPSLKGEFVLVLGPPSKAEKKAEKRQERQQRRAARQRRPTKNAPVSEA